MAKKMKELCKWEQADLLKQYEAFCDIVRKPKYACSKCGRVADKKKWLHKPIPLK